MALKTSTHILSILVQIIIIVIIIIITIIIIIIIIIIIFDLQEYICNNFTYIYILVSHIYRYTVYYIYIQIFI